MKLKTTSSLLILGLIPSLGFAQEKFSTQQIDTNKAIVCMSSPAQRKENKIPLRPGELIEVFDFHDQAGVPRVSFYLPPEATSVVQLVKERQGRVDRYFLRGIRKGRTAGGIVPSAWLASDGFHPKSATDEIRIQTLIKANPLFITVE